ncbi:hypothetical protein [Dongshaea marina]|uniref:hypothetical protein n=1 Tax=Dongshaea marina TaxID=2047966 RepID=UPI000D3E3F4A|nr:hypothetical protein [Dongshaea marina]
MDANWLKSQKENIVVSIQKAHGDGKKSVSLRVTEDKRWMIQSFPSRLKNDSYFPQGQGQIANSKIKHCTGDFELTTPHVDADKIAEEMIEVITTPKSA